MNINNINIIGLAHVLGDSLGAQYEFRHNKARSYLRGFHYEPRMFSRFQGKKTCVMGQWTDDTEMTLCLLKNLQNCEDHNYDSSTAISSYMEWANSHPFGMGKTTRKLFHGITTVNGYRKRIERLKKSNDSVLGSQSNGSLMRAWPLSFFTNAEEAVVEDCKLTNNNPINIECSVIYTYILQSLANKTFDSHHLLEMATDENVKRAISDALLGTQRKFLKGQDGWVVHGIYFAVFASTSEMPILDVYDYIIQCRIDPDTTAAIAGAVLGAKYGEDFLKNPEICSLLQVILDVKTENGEVPRPDMYHPKTYYSLE